MTTAVSCRFIAADDETAYTALLMADPGNLIYATLPFLAFLRQVTKARVEVIVAEKDGVLVGALPFAVLGHARTGFVLNSLPWWGSHGSVVLERTRPDAVEIRAGLLQALAQEIDRIMPLSSTIVLLPEEHLAQEEYLSILRPDVAEARSGQMTILPQDNANLGTELLAMFKQKTRNLVRKSFKQGFEEIVSDEDWAAEYYSMDIAAGIVPSVEAAVEHILTWSSGHTEAIVSSSAPTIAYFTSAVDSAAVMVNASTRFTDGGEFGFGAEIGISTQKLHARGPMGLTELTTTTFIVSGNGQIRK